jgi:hypothetical protein
VRAAVVSLFVLLAAAAPAAAKDGPIGAAGQPTGTQTECSPGACTYIAEGSLAGRAPANGTLTSFTLGHGPVSSATTVRLDVFDDTGGTLTLQRQSAGQNLAVGPAGIVTYDLSAGPLAISSGEIIGVTLTPSSGYAPAATLSQGDSSNSALACDGSPAVGMTFFCNSIPVVAYTVALSAFFYSDIRPPVVTPQPETGVGPYAATVNALVNPSGAATTAIVHYGTSPSSLSTYGSASNMGSGTADVPYSQQLTGLQPSTTYYYKVAATNTTDTTFESPQSFTTAAPPLPDLTEDPLPADLTGTTATLTGQVNPEGTATDVRVLYGTSDPPTTQSPATQFSGSTAQNYSRQISGLANDTTYYWRLAAYRNSVEVAAGPVQQFTTYRPPDVAESDPSAVGETSVDLNGLVTPHGRTSTWHFDYGTTGAYGQSSPDATVSGSQGTTPTPVSATLTGLAPDTQYFWRLSASSDGGSAQTIGGTFRTAAGNAPLVGDFVVARLDAVSVLLNFSVDPQGYATTFAVEWGETPAYGNMTPRSNPTGATRGAIPVHWSQDGLAPATTYHYRVLATNRWGTTAGPDQSWTTLAAELPPPVIGRTANAFPEKGNVLIKLPPGTSAAKAKALGLEGAAAGFIPLSEARHIPIRSTLDTTRGTVKLLTSAGTGKAAQAGHFRGGLFVLGQAKKNPLTTLSMTGGGLSRCHTRVPAGGVPKPLTAARTRRTLFSRVRGHFSSRGRNSSATVRGTEWTMTDTCAGTLTAVKRGAVTVRDFRLRKTRLVKAGQRYLARAR